MWVENSSNIFYFDLDEKPDIVSFDPDNVILKEWSFVKSKEELMLEVEHGRLPNRLWALQQLKKYSNDKSVHKFLSELGHQAIFWAVRKEALMAQSDSNPDIDYLKERATDSNSKVRATALDLLGDKKNLALQSFFQK